MRLKNAPVLVLPKDMLTDFFSSVQPMAVLIWLIDWLVFYGTSTQDRSICANLPGGIIGSGVWG